ncbi:DUF5412 domain-containing protein [Lysinibacillus piscis]|uniref:Uncharacterized protein n=1 Tax=Lysinibacillus piscis TaxID=2518931 RepID=A0ABQ5NMN2_9BACI|nr:DUF5412 domain-containing protein [Lysinibacillus sp. KH24]GLC89605.1 hypothetical protein LYSBPC_27320 [Lysinibacillus sp. KH24]
MNNTLFNVLMLAGIFFMLLTILLAGIFIIRMILRAIRRDKTFPKRHFQILSIGGILSVVFLLNWLYNPYFLPKGFLDDSKIIAYGDNEARIYHYTGFIPYKNVRVEIYNKNTHDARTIYYNYVNGPLGIAWLDEVKIQIEGKVLDIRKDTYDFRKDG